MNIKQRPDQVIILLIFLTVLLMLVSIVQGEYSLSLFEIVKSLFGLSHNPDSFFVIYHLRLPRVLIAWLVGVGLAISGTILQSITRNPLCDPGILGINGGAALAAVILIVVFPGSHLSLLALAAFSGGWTVAIAIYWLAWSKNNTALNLILVGISLNLLVSAITNFLLTFGEIGSVAQALVWLVGSVYGKGWQDILIFLPWLLLLSILSWGLSRELNILSLGEELAGGLGINIPLVRTFLLLIAVVLASISVAIAGTIGFVGLMSSHLGRFWVGDTHQELLPVAALNGGLLVVGADLVGRCFFYPVEIPCGIITSLLGAPYFVLLLRRK